VDICERVSTFVEVQEGFTPEMARGEASRCMRCYYVGMVSLKSKY
jgi:NADPH-dependent glutamate synthase beta subunit-like oxidoreductase